MFLHIFCFLLGGGSIYRLYRLLVNYRAARHFQLPIVLLPASFEEPLWVLVRPMFGWVEKLPFRLGSWYLYTDMGWPLIDEGRTIGRLGETFVLCSPVRNQIITAFPPAVDRLYKDRSFILPSPFAEAFTQFGENVSSTNGADWQRHRKVTAPAFNERNNRYVWQEAAKLTRDLIARTPDSTEWTLGTIRSKMNELAMHVLITVAFGQDVDLSMAPPGHQLPLMEAMGFILQRVFITIIFAGLKLPDNVLPPILRKLKLSMAEIKLYMQETVLRQLQAKEAPLSSTGGLLEGLVTANEAEKQATQASGSTKSFLTDSELYGNLFVFSLAGYETTASSMSFCLAYLAVYPAYQAWLTEEIDALGTNLHNLKYDDAYPRLPRHQGFLMEVLRFASPAGQMARAPTSPTSLPVSSTREIVVDSATMLTADFYAVHLSSRWGPDAHVFNPKRFITKSSSTGEDVLASPPEGAIFMAWVFGSRVCPGKKFSQVEFVAVVANLLAKFRVEPVGKAYETEQETQKRIQAVISEKYFNISAHIKRPEDAAVRFVSRK